MFTEKTIDEQANMTATELASYKNAEKANNDNKINERIAKAVSEVSEKSSKEIETLKEGMSVQSKALKDLREGGYDLKTVEDHLSKFIEKNSDSIKNAYAQGHGLVEFDITKVVADITTGSATSPVAPPELMGSQVAPPSNVNLRDTFVDSLVTNLGTSLAVYPYTDTLPKDGDFSFVAEGVAKDQIDFSIETRYATPVKVAAWERLTMESVQDIKGLQSIATDYLRKKHNLKRQNGILFGDGIAPNPTGATVYGRVFSAGAMALAVANPNIMDVINACVTDIYTTQNYVDEMAYMPSLAVLNPTDFYLQFVAVKNADGNPLYPTASLFNRVNIGGMTIIPERSVPAGKIFVADMSKYNVTNYMGYTVKIGWVNDDFIKNQFVILGESRFHAFVRELDKQAFIYDDIATISTAIATV